MLVVIEAQPDLTLDEIVAVMRKQTVPGSRTALFRFLERRAVTSKKSFKLPNRSGRMWLALASDGYAAGLG